MNFWYFMGFLPFGLLPIVFPRTHKFTPNIKELKCAQCLKNLGYEVIETVINFHVYGS